MKKKSINFDYDEFLMNQSKWNRHQFSLTNYSYDFFSFGFSPYSWHAEVKTNSISFSSMSFPIEYHFIVGKSMDEIFYDIENTYLTYSYLFETDTYDKEYYLTDIIIKYETNYNFPKEILYRFYNSPDIAVDGNYYSVISNFTIYDN